MRYMHCPQHVGQNTEHNMHSVNAIRPDVVGFTEMDAGVAFPSASIKAARRILSSYTVCTDAHNVGPHSQEVPIAVRRSPLTRIQSTQVIHLSPLVPPGGISQDRYATIVRYRRPLFRGAHVAVHTNAAIQGAKGGILNNRRAAVTKAAMIKLEALIKTLKAEGRQVTVTGDFNYRTHPDVTNFHLWEYGPQRTFQRLGMTFHEEGLDYVAWTGGLQLHTAVRVIPEATALNGSDHPWLVADLRYKRGKK